MKKYLKLECKRIAHEKRLWIALAVGLFISVLHWALYVLPIRKYLSEFEGKGIGTIYPHTWYEKWIGGEWWTLLSYVFFIIIPLLAAGPWGSSLHSDRKSGYTKNLFVKGKKSYYYISKYICSFLCGGVTVIAPLIVNILLSAATLPSLTPQAVTGTSTIFANCMWSKLFYTTPNLYVLFYLVIIFTYSGLFSVLATVMGAITESGFVALVFPFIVNLFAYIIFNSAESAKFVPFMFLTPAQRSGEATDFTVIVIEALVLFVITVLLMTVSCKKDETL